MLAGFLPLLLLVFGSANLEGLASPLPLTTTVAWLLVGLAGFAWLDARLRAGGHEPETVQAWQHRFHWALAAWIVGLWWAASPVRLLLGLGPGPALAQTVVVLPAGLLFVALLAATHHSFYVAMGPWRLASQTPADHLRARLSVPLLFFPPILAWIAIEDLCYGNSLNAVVELASSPAKIALIPLFFVGLYLVSPSLFNLAWRAQPLDDPRLAARLMQLAQEAGIPLSGVRVWDTFGEPIPNAAVAGLSRRFRFVYLTGYLRETVPDHQIVAIVAHELAHLRLGHVWVYLLFSLDLACFSLGTGFWLYYHHPRLLLSFPDLTTWLDLAFFLAGFFLVFTALARRAELQADQFAARLVGPAAMGEALGDLAARLGEEAGGRGGWRQWFATHPGFATRLERLARPAPLAQLASESRRWLVALVAVGLLLLGVGWPTFGLAGDLERGRLALAAGRHAEAAAMLARCRARVPTHPDVLDLAARLALAEGRYVRAAAAGADTLLDLNLTQILDFPGGDRRAGSEVAQEAAAPEVAAQFDLVEFLLQLLHFH